MARIVKLDQTRPYRIPPEQFPKDGKSIWICACGLTKTWPFCDKSHVACDTEEPGKAYEYAADGSRREVAE
jgi:CDGSH-type Zn-finger protein